MFCLFKGRLLCLAWALKVMFLSWLCLSLAAAAALEGSLTLPAFILYTLRLQSCAMFKCHVFERESHHPDFSVSPVPVAVLDSHIFNPIIIYYLSLPGTTESVSNMVTVSSLSSLTPKWSPGLFICLRLFFLFFLVPNITTSILSPPYWKLSSSACQTSLTHFSL